MSELTALTDLCRKYRQAEMAVEQLEADLKAAKEVFRHISEEEIPEMMDNLDVSEVRLADGVKVIIKPFTTASIKVANRAEAFAWLRENGHGDIIKNTVSAAFSAGEEELATDLLTQLQGEGFDVDRAEKVESSTLRAWATKELEKGQPLPDCITTYTGRKTVLK